MSVRCLPSDADRPLEAWMKAVVGRNPRSRSGTKPISSRARPVGAARSRKTFLRFVASWRAAGKLRARATVFLHFRRNMNTDRDICTEERGSLREGVAALDAKR